MIFSQIINSEEHYVLSGVKAFSTLKECEKEAWICFVCKDQVERMLLEITKYNFFHLESFK